MEILIPGLLLVALMVYASTKIKKTAARAYEEEPIEAADFALTKPEGFIHPLNTESRFAFQAYSKDFGNDGSEELRQARINLLVSHDGVDAAREAATAGALSVKKDTALGVIEVERTENSRRVNVFYKFESADGKLFELRATVLREHRDEYLRKIRAMFESFRVKK